ncbi:MAG: pirin family protein [Thermoanaerobaculia bacterium]
MKPKSVAAVVEGRPTREGAGFLVHRPFPGPELDWFDPFLLLDEMGPMDLAPGEAKGAPDHPHRGFETVTYMIAGEMEHGDSAGHSGKIAPGDVQWMTAGAGVVHSEMPSSRILREGGRMHGFQLWVNLPKSDKMMAPRYQEVPGTKIPEAEGDGIRVRVIAGEALGASAVIDTRTPIAFMHFTLEPGATLTQPVPSGYEVFAYVFDGEGIFGEEHVGRGRMVVFTDDGDAVVVNAAKGSDLQFLLIGGVPIREPVARYGPFVMNYKAEILQAIDDYQNGRMGRIEPA